jgi:NAD(P)-dependent dehydrogenase (short-subunit alcohol dehydrogenase family)
MHRHSLADQNLAVMYGLTLSLKNEIVSIAPKGRVNTVAPGWVKTPMAAEAMKDQRVVYRSMATYKFQVSSIRRHR